MLEGDNMDNMAPCVQVGVQECVASGERLCVGAVHVPGTGMCMYASSAAVLGEQ